MVDFIHNAGGQTDLVAVGGIARCGSGDNFPLRQLAGNGLGHGFQGIGSAGNPHGTVHIAPAGQGVPDSAADAGSSAAEGLDFRGMVVGFVLEKQQPGFFHAVYRDVHLYGAGVDFLALIQFVQLSHGAQVLDRNGRQIHQTDGLGLTAKGIPGGEVGFVGLLEQRIGKGNIVNDGAEGGVPAMIGPVGVDHPDFRDGGVPVLADKIGLAEGDVIQVHGQAIVVDEILQPLLVQLGEALQGGNLGGNLIGNGQGFRDLQGSFPALHRVNHILLELRQLFLGQIAVQGVDLSGADQGTFALGDDLDALGGGIGPLVKLTGQGLHGEHRGTGQLHGSGGGVQLGLGEYGLHGVIKQLLGDVFRVVPVKQPQIFQAGNAQQVAGFAEQTLGLVVQTGLLFHKYTINHGVSS